MSLKLMNRQFKTYEPVTSQVGRGVEGASHGVLMATIFICKVILQFNDASDFKQMECHICRLERFDCF